MLINAHKIENKLLCFFFHFAVIYTIVSVFIFAERERERERERETTEHIPTRAHPSPLSGSYAPPPVGGEVGISKSKCKAKLMAVVGAVCS